MRKSDKKLKQFIRSADRISCQDGLWYFETRGGDRGPFRSRKAAQFELDRYVDAMDFMEDRKNDLPVNVDGDDVTFVDIDETPSIF